jgi:hypothetical protein
MVAADADTRLSLLRVRLDKVGRAHRQRVAKRREESSQQKLRSAKRKAVSEKV